MSASSFPFLLALAACARGTPVRPPPAPVAPPKVPALQVAASETVTWTKLAEGTISSRQTVGEEPFDSPIVTWAASGETAAMLLRTDRYVLRLVTDGKPAIEIALGLEYRGGTRVAAVALDEQTARVAIQDDRSLAVYLVRLADGRVTTRAIEANTSDYSYDYVAAAPAGWIVAGYRTHAGKQTDPVAWFAADDATTLGEPFALAHVPTEHAFRWIRGEVAPDGTALIGAEVPNPDGSSQQVLAIRHDKTWTALATVPGALAADFVRANDRWFVDRLAAASPSVDVLDPKTGARQALDGAWAAPGRARAALPGATWTPGLVLPLPDALCMFGGAADSSAPPKHTEIHGAACLDRKTAAWRWLASPATPVRCGHIGSSFVLCGDRKSWHTPANWEWPERDHYGPYEWSLWRVRLPAQPR